MLAEFELTDQTGRMATARKQVKKKHPEEKSDKKVFDFTEEDEKKGLSGSEDDVREGEWSWLAIALAGCNFSTVKLRKRH